MKKYTVEKENRDQAWFVIDVENDVSVCRCGHESDARRIAAAMNGAPKRGRPLGAKGKMKKPEPMTTNGGAFLRLPQILSRIPVARSTLWTWVREGRFPKPVKLGPMTTAWREADVNQWVSQSSQGMWA